MNGANWIGLTMHYLGDCANATKLWCSRRNLTSLTEVRCTLTALSCDLSVNLGVLPRAWKHRNKNFGGPKENRTPINGVTSRYTDHYTMRPELLVVGEYHITSLFIRVDLIRNFNYFKTHLSNVF